MLPYGTPYADYALPRSKVDNADAKEPTYHTPDCNITNSLRQAAFRGRHKVHRRPGDFLFGHLGAVWCDRVSVPVVWMTRLFVVHDSSTIQ
jgi:hypothetical protein